MVAGTSQTIETEERNMAFTSSTVNVGMIIAIVVSSVCLIAVNSSVLYYFFGNATRTDTSYLLPKTELYQIEQGLHAKIDENVKELQLLVDQHGSSSNVEIGSKFSKLSRVLEDMMSEYDSEIANLKAAIPEKEVDELTDSFQKLREKVDEVDINKPNVTFIYESDITRLLEKENFDKIFRSEFIFCRGLSWHLFYTNRNNDFLSVYLKPNNPETTPWKINTDFKITVLNQSGKFSVSNKRRWTFSDKQKNDQGFPDLISLKRLQDEGFIKENKIQLKLELIAERLIRNAPAKLN